MKDFHDLKAFAEAEGFFVTSTTGGTHNVGSKHALGLAIDVRTRDKSNDQIDTFLLKCRLLGVRVRDERNKPDGQKVWSGAHLHLDIGADTEAAVRAFQRENNLIVDGIVGAKTIAALDALF